MIEHLKVYIKTLAYEAQAIRKQERKAKTSKAYRRAAKSRIRNGIAEHAEPFQNRPTGFRTLTNVEAELAHKQTQTPTSEQLATYQSLHSRRILEVRREARSAFLAYAFLRGHSYADVEGDAFHKPHWSRIEELVKKYGTEDDRVRLNFWRQNTVWAAYASVAIMMDEEGITFNNPE